jgi:hypothetical protein
MWNVLQFFIARGVASLPQLGTWGKDDSVSNAYFQSWILDKFVERVQPLCGLSMQ